MRVFIVLPVIALPVAVLAACAAPARAPEPTSPTATPPPPDAPPAAALEPEPEPAKLDWQLDGKPVEPRSALTVTRGGTALEVMVSDADVDCQALAEGKRVPDEARFELRVANRISPEGERGWGVVHSYFKSATKQGYAGPVEIEPTEPETGDTVRLGFDIELSGAGDPKPRMVARGTVDATHCGEEKGGAQPEPLAGIEWSVEGHALPVRSAHVQKMDDRLKVTLHSADRDCGRLAGDAAVTLNLTGDAPEFTHAFLRGDLFDRQTTGGNRGAFAVELAGPLTGDSVKVTISGQDDITSFTTAIDGTVQAEVCQ